jgi:uncharacterized GH25 family protein
MKTTIFTAAFLAAAMALPAAAHELIVVPGNTSVTAGETLSFEVHSTHVFAAPEEMEAPESVAASLMPVGQDAAEAEISPGDLYLAGQVAVPGDGPAWLLAHRLGQVWSQTDEGWKQGGRDVNPDANVAAKYEKFSKTLLNAGGEGYSQPVGQLLEIVPLSDPASLAPGDTLMVQVLYNGQPVHTQVAATFAGFSERGNTWAYVTETFDGGDGAVAEVQTWGPGLWFVRAQFVAPGGEGYDEHVLRAITSFEVAEVAS